MRSLRGVVQFLIYGIEREWDEYLSILFQSGSSLEGEVGTISAFEKFIQVLFYWFIGSRIEMRIRF